MTEVNLTNLTKNPLMKTCNCSKCKLSSVMSRDQPYMHIYQSYLDFAQECLNYQQLVHKKQVQNQEGYLNQIVNFDKLKVDKRTLDIIFQDYIRNYSQYVLKDSFDLGIKKSYYAIHKKVEGVLKERNIQYQNPDQNVTKLIDAYKLEKNKLFVQAKEKMKEKKVQFHKSFRSRHAKSNDGLRNYPIQKCYMTEVTQNSEPNHFPEFECLQRDSKNQTFRTTKCKFKVKTETDEPPHHPFSKTFMELKKRKLWRQIHISMKKKIESRKLKLR